MINFPSNLNYTIEIYAEDQNIGLMRLKFTSSTKCMMLRDSVAENVD